MMGGWWIARAFIVLKYLLKNRQNDDAIYTCMCIGTENIYCAYLHPSLAFSGA
jgi:hypothetical protein